MSGRTPPDRARAGTTPSVTGGTITALSASIRHEEDGSWADGPELASRGCHAAPRRPVEPRRSVVECDGHGDFAGARHYRLGRVGIGACRSRECGQHGRNTHIVEVVEASHPGRHTRTFSRPLTSAEFPTQIV